MIVVCVRVRVFHSTPIQYSLVTPKRKLSMDLDESTQDASDSGK